MMRRASDRGSQSRVSYHRRPGRESVWSDGLGTVAGPFWKRVQSCAPAQSEARIAWSGGAASLRWIRARRARGPGARRAPRRCFPAPRAKAWRARHSHHPCIDGEPEVSSQILRESYREKNSFRRSGGGAGCDDPRSCAVIGWNRSADISVARRPVRSPHVYRAGTGRRRGVR